MRNKSLCKSFAISNNTVEFFGDSRSKQFEKDSALYKIGLHLNSFLFDQIYLNWYKKKAQRVFNKYRK